MKPRTRSVCIAIGLSILAGALACQGPGATGGPGIELTFAQMGQAETAEPGLPAEVGSLRVDVLAMGALGEDPVASTGCLSPGAGDEARSAVSLDLDPADNLAVQVLGWPTAGCGADEAAEWKGLSFWVSVKKGGEKANPPVPIYVTRRGFRLNPIRDTLPAGRAFATATALPGGRVLIAGGFDRLSGAQVPVTLSAACDALIYDPGRARIVEVLQLPKGCRGLHRALTRPDGKVLLIGGATEATFDPTGVTRPMLRPQATSLLSSVEIFDPTTGAFETGQGPDPDLRRALMAAVAVDEQTLLLLGGRTDQLRSDEIVLGAAGTGGTIDWRTEPETLTAARAGAEALAQGQGVLIAGGNAPGTPSLELLLPDNLFAYSLDLGGVDNDRLALGGHGLVAVGGSSFVLSGGAANTPGALPTDAVFTGIWSGETYGLTETAMARARAYHASVMMQGIGVGGTLRTVHIGGLGEDLASNADLEVVDPATDGLLLEDPLGTGAIGVTAVVMADGTALVFGGLDLDAAGRVSLSAEARVLAP